jgi:hypothetical protein
MHGILANGDGESSMTILGMAVTVAVAWYVSRTTVSAEARKEREARRFNALMEISDSVEALCQAMVNLTAEQFAGHSDSQPEEFKDLSKTEEFKEFSENEIVERRLPVFEAAHVFRLQIGRAQILGHEPLVS